MFDECSANPFLPFLQMRLNARKAALFPLSIQLIHNYILPFPCIEMFSWFKRIKIT